MELQSRDARDASSGQGMQGMQVRNQCVEALSASLHVHAARLTLVQRVGGTWRAAWAGCARACQAGGGGWSGNGAPGSRCLSARGVARLPRASAALRLYLYQRATKLGHWCKLGHSCCVAQTVLLASLHTASLHTTSPPACHTSGRWQGEQAKKNGNQSLKACQHAPVNGMAGQPSARQSPSVQTKTTSRSICSTLGCRK